MALFSLLEAFLVNSANFSAGSASKTNEILEDNL
jgi:hypothetical protein